MKKKNLWIVIVIAVLIVAAACFWFVLRSQNANGSKKITVDVTHKDGQTTTFEIHTDEEYLRGALEQEGLISGTETDYGLYVLTVDNETADENNQEWWGYTKSGEMVDVGVDSCPIADGDHYEFTLNIGW